MIEAQVRASRKISRRSSSPALHFPPSCELRRVSKTGTPAASIFAQADIQPSKTPIWSRRTSATSHEPKPKSENDSSQRRVDIVPTTRGLRAPISRPLAWIVGVVPRSGVIRDDGRYSGGVGKRAVWGRATPMGGPRPMFAWAPVGRPPRLTPALRSGAEAISALPRSVGGPSGPALPRKAFRQTILAVRLAARRSIDPLDC